MRQLFERLSVRADLHAFPKDAFGTLEALVDRGQARSGDTLLIASSEMGTAPDNISILDPERLVVLQHIGPSIPSRQECERYEGLTCDDLEALFEARRFRHVIVCGHLHCRVIRYWLQPANARHADQGHFRQRFEDGTRRLVDEHYTPESVAEQHVLLICEHVLCQLENLLSHPFVQRRAADGALQLHGWVVDDATARVFRYNLSESAFEAG